MENPPKKFFRLAPGQMVRLKSAYIIRCDEVIKDEQGEVTELKCTYFLESKSGSDTSGLSVKGTLHWVSREQAVPVELRLYDRLFSVEDPTDSEADFKSFLNPESLQVVQTAYAEPALTTATLTDRFQFLRQGYFVLDKDSTSEKVVFNKTVGLKDAWAKEVKKS